MSFIKASLTACLSFSLAHALWTSAIAAEPCPLEQSLAILGRESLDLGTFEVALRTFRSAKERGESPPFPMGYEARMAWIQVFTATGEMSPFDFRPLMENMTLRQAQTLRDVVSTLAGESHEKPESWYLQLASKFPEKIPLEIWAKKLQLLHQWKTTKKLNAAGVEKLLLRLYDVLEPNPLRSMPVTDFLTGNDSLAAKNHWIRQIERDTISLNRSDIALRLGVRPDSPTWTALRTIQQKHARKLSIAFQGILALPILNGTLPAAFTSLKTTRFAALSKKIVDLWIREGEDAAYSAFQREFPLTPESTLRWEIFKAAYNTVFWVSFLGYKAQDMYWQYQEKKEELRRMKKQTDALIQVQEETAQKLENMDINDVVLQKTIEKLEEKWGKPLTPEQIEQVRKQIRSD